MKFPKTLKIGGHQVKVLFPYRFRERSDYSSQADVLLGEIRVSGVNPSGVRYAESRLKNHLITEIIRYVLKVYCGEVEVSGKAVTGLGNGWFQVFSSSPAFLVGKGKIPKQLLIGGHVMTIRFPYLFQEREDVIGRCHNHVNEIHLAGVDTGGTKLCSSMNWVNLLHEVNHAIHVCFCAGEEDKEAVTEAVAQGLYQVFVDNDLDFRGEIKE